MNLKKYTIGCDIGGSHISCGIIDVATGFVEDSDLVNIEVDNTSKSDILIEAWKNAIKMCYDRIPKDGEFLGVGLAIPGPFDYKNGIGLYDNSNQKFIHLKGINIKHDLSVLLKIEASKIKFTNDASSFALGSFWFGTGRGYNKVAVITLGTGFGSSFVDNGRVISIGTTVPENGYLWDKPFRNGIADDYFSTRWFVNSYNDLGGITVGGVHEISKLAGSGDESAKDLFKTFGDNLAECLSPHLQNFKAEILVIGGNIGEALHFFEPNLRKGFLESNIKIKIKVSELKDRAAMLGAVAIYKQ